MAAGLAGAAVALSWAAALCPAQDVHEGESATVPASADGAIEGYLDRLGLKELLADHLAARVKQAPPDEKKSIGERLAKIYVDMLGAAATAEQRKPWEDRGRELLQIVPEADSYELRISLARAVYIHAEAIVERSRLRLTKAEEAADAERMLRTVKTEFTDVATKAHSRVETLERLEQNGGAGGGRDTEQISQALGEARRLRSLAFYYAGWTDYYLAYLTASDRLAADAMRSFGWLLNARGGVPASLEKLPAGLLKYEHISRAAIGCALCASLRGNDVEATRWLDAVAETTGLPASVRDQLLLRRITVLGASKRWADLEREIRRTRKAERSGRGPAVEPLAVLPARLLAVITLEADRRNAGELIERLAQIALGDMVARGDTAQVLDIVQRYGTAPIGETGFIVHYVRGVQVFEQARAAHRAAGNSDEPSTSDAVVNQYRQSAALLDAALREADAASFGAERWRAAMVVGQALFFAGDFAGAADRFLESAKAALKPEQGEEPMWLAIASLDRAAKAGGAGAVKRRDETAALYLKSYPDSPRSAQLLVSLGNANLLEDEAAVKILLSVPKGSPSYDASRRQAVRLLYSMYRTAKPEQRDFAAMRFVSAAEELLAEDRRLALEAEAGAAREAAERVVTRVRQVLDAVLSTPSADAGRAESALEVLDAVALHAGLDLTPFKPELSYRRVQVLLARGTTAEAVALGDQMRAEATVLSKQYADSADRLLYRAALAAWQRASTGDPAGAEARAAVIRFGSRIISALGSTPQALADPATMSLHATIADAAAKVWEETQDGAMRNLSIRLDRAILAAQPRSEAPLRRLARTAEAAGDSATALDCWRTLIGGMDTGTPTWFEARYNVLLLLSAIDKDAARVEMQRHKVLFPAFGPEPWGERLRALDQALGPPPAPPKPAGGAP